MKNNKMKKMVSLMAAILVLCSALTVHASAAEFVVADGSRGAESRAYKAMYTYDTDTIDGVTLVNALYNQDTYAFTIARVETGSNPSETSFNLDAKVYAVYTPLDNDNSSNSVDNLVVPANSAGYCNSGNAYYDTSKVVDYLLGSNYYNGHLHEQYRTAGIDFVIS